MSLKKNSEIKYIQGNEGTKIKQYFHPHNTLNGINFSMAQFTLEPGKKSKLHKMIIGKKSTKRQKARNHILGSNKRTTTTTKKTNRRR